MEDIFCFMEHEFCTAGSPHPVLLIQFVAGVGRWARTYAVLVLQKPRSSGMDLNFLGIIACDYFGICIGNALPLGVS